MEVDGIEETAMEVVVEAGGETAGEREALCPPTTAGRTSLRTATMVEVVEEAEVETTGEVEAVEVSGTATTGPNLCPGMRGWSKSCSRAEAANPRASISTDTRIFPWRRLDPTSHNPSTISAP